MIARAKWFPALILGLVIALLFWITWRFASNMQQLNRIDTAPLFRVALLLEGPSFDQGWNSGALESISLLRSQYPYELDIADQLTPHQIADTAASFASRGYDLIIGHGVIFSEPFYQVSPLYPSTRFVTFNGKAVYPNQTNIRYDMSGAGFLAGKLAALMSKSGKIGYIMADQSNEVEQKEWFKRAAQSVTPSITVEIAAVSSYNDNEGALQAARQMIENGVDVIYTLGDSYNLPVITEIQKANIYGIGYIADQQYIAPNHVLASIVQDVQMVYRHIVTQFANNTLPPGEVSFGLPEGANRLSPFGPMVPDSVAHQIRKDLQEIMERKHVTSNPGR